MSKFFKTECFLLIFLGLAFSLGCLHAQTTDSRLVLNTTEHELPGGKISRGSYAVFEDREAKAGRMIKLDLVILHATGSDPKPDPLFYLAGGPGQANVDVYRGFVESWIRQDRHIVFVNVRGTGGDNDLQCELHGGDDNIQGYLENPFDVEEFRTCLEELEKKFDLTKYSTPLAMDDLNDVRKALGYEKINLMGTSGAPGHHSFTCAAIRRGCAPLSSSGLLLLHTKIHCIIPRVHSMPWIFCLRNVWRTVLATMLFPTWRRNSGQCSSALKMARSKSKSLTLYQRK